MRRAHLLRWRPLPHAQRTDSTPRVRPSGAALQLDPSHRSSRRSPTGRSRMPSVKRLLSVALVLALLGSVTAAPADDPDVPEKYIKVEEAKALLDQKTRLAFIDVRPREQFDDTHIRGAVNIPYNQLRDHLAEVPTQVPVVLY